MTVNKFIASKVRIKIIRYFVIHPQSSFHIRELVRILKDEVNAVRRELINLERTGLLVSQRQSNKICYTLNHDYYLLPEFRSIIHKEYGLGAQVLKNKKQLGEIKFALLTYTFISMGESSSNDLDLIIVGEPDERVLDVVVKNAEEDLKRDIFYTIMSEKEWTARIKRRDAQALSAILLPRVLLIGNELELATI